MLLKILSIVLAQAQVTRSLKMLRSLWEEDILFTLKAQIIYYGTLKSNNVCLLLVPILMRRQPFGF